MNTFFEKDWISRNQFLYKDAISNVELWLKREDEIHPIISGNKFRKLKYNLTTAKKEGKTKLLTFGGAYSNHISAVAEAAHLVGLESIGVIRGDELVNQLPELFKHNATLAHANNNGMQFHFESRENYRNKETVEQLEIYKSKFGDAFVIPEGGTNFQAIKGCSEILNEEDSKFDIVCCSAGTGGTAAGLIESTKRHQQVVAFSALKGDFLTKEIKTWTNKTNWKLNSDFHFGGYAKVSDNLIAFINSFYELHHIPLDPIYTGKMFFGLFQLIKSGYFSENTRILAIHTGGLQGVESMNFKLRSKQLETIKFN